MNILLVSQCDKRSLTESRRILDQFAERRGDRTWQTPITQAGLDTLRKLLPRTARKNTAVACHWIRGLDHSELLWIVGDAGRFNAQGAVPTGTTTRNVLRRGDENDWHRAEDIRLLAQLAAFLHAWVRPALPSRPGYAGSCRNATSIATNGCRYACSRPSSDRTTMRADCVVCPIRMTATHLTGQLTDVTAETAWIPIPAARSNSCRRWRQRSPC